MPEQKQAFRPSLITRILNFLRGHRSEPKNKRFPLTYQVMVSVDHPRIIGHIVSFEVRIDAHNKQHARMQLARGLQIKIGRATRA